MLTATGLLIPSQIGCGSDHYLTYENIVEVPVEVAVEKADWRGTFEAFLELKTR